MRITAMEGFEFGDDFVLCKEKPVVLLRSDSGSGKSAFLRGLIRQVDVNTSEGYEATNIVFIDGNDAERHELMSRYLLVSTDESKLAMTVINETIDISNRKCVYLPLLIVIDEPNLLVEKNKHFYNDLQSLLKRITPHSGITLVISTSENLFDMLGNLVIYHSDIVERYKLYNTPDKKKRVERVSSK